MILSLIAEATEYDFKSKLERNKTVSWLKSVSAFANGIGGTLFFGVADDSKVIGLDDAQSDADFISRRIKDRITPMPDFVLTPHSDDGRVILALVVKAGRSTPYYYSSDGRKTAYIRIGSESVPAPDHVLNELILKGSNRTFDVVATDYKKEDFSFTLLEATYRQRTRLRFAPSDYYSFGLVNEDGYLTRAGSLLTDQHSVYNSRIFCTRWNGLDKGSIFDDALDDKEISGNLIYLLQGGCDFVKNNSKVRFEKSAMERIDKPDYAERAVAEALVNALIHRDYITMGAEVHIDMYDNRLEITSPGGMYKGRAVQEQDINQIESERRNPILADLFHRMRYMERRGSGLKKILNETKSLPGFRAELIPKFYSDTSFRVTIYNVNYTESLGDSNINIGDSIGVSIGVNIGNKLNATQAKLLDLMRENATISAKNMAAVVGIAQRNVESNIRILKNMGLVERVGSTKSGRWFVKDV